MLITIGAAGGQIVMSDEQKISLYESSFLAHRGQFILLG